MEYFISLSNTPAVFVNIFVKLQIEKIISFISFSKSKMDPVKRTQEKKYFGA